MIKKQLVIYFCVLLNTMWFLGYAASQKPAAPLIGKVIPGAVYYLKTGSLNNTYVRFMGRDGNIIASSKGSDSGRFA